MTVQPAGRNQAAACLFCGRPVVWIERRGPVFTLAGVAAHAGCCGGCTSKPAGARQGTNSAAR